MSQRRIAARQLLAGTTPSRGRGSADAYLARRHATYAEEQTHRLEDALVALVINAVLEREVDRVVLAFLGTDVLESRYVSTALGESKVYLEITGAGEILTKLVERDTHHSIGGVESLLDTITVMNIDINVEYTLMVPTRWMSVDGILNSKTMYLSSSRIARTISFT